MRNAGIVDEDRDGAEGLLRGVERTRHGDVVGHIRFDGKCLAALSFDVVFERLKPIGPPRHQRDSSAIVCQCLGKLGAKAA